MWSLHFLAAFCLLCAVSAGKRKDDCPPCQLEKCPEITPSSCLFGMKEDGCGCCRICARMEGETCDLEGEDYKLGSCGEMLKCTKTEFGNYCLCRHNEIICGTDKVTYTNMCQLVAAKRRSGLHDLEVAVRGPCNPGAAIVTAPEFTRNYTGGSIVLSCEAVGMPTPYLAWLYTRADNETFTLPGDDEHMLVAARGGPGRFKTTGWLQLEGLEERHEGDYTCVARNKHNTAYAKARVKVVEPRK